MMQLHVGFLLDLIHMLKTCIFAVVLHKGFSFNLKSLLRVFNLSYDFTQGLFMQLEANV